MLWLVTPESPSLPKEKTQPFSLFCFFSAFFRLFRFAKKINDLKSKTEFKSSACICIRTLCPWEGRGRVPHFMGTSCGESLRLDMIFRSTTIQPDLQWSATQPYQNLSNFSNSEHVKMRRCLNCHTVPLCFEIKQYWRQGKACGTARELPSLMQSWDFVRFRQTYALGPYELIALPIESAIFSKLSLTPSP